MTTSKVIGVGVERVSVNICKSLSVINSHIL